jgi:hypothetical protein
VCDAAFPFARGWFTRFIDDSAEWADSTELAPLFRDFADDEREATALLVCGTTVLPGLLQPEAYARAVLSRHPGVTDELVAKRVAARIARQDVLESVTLWALVDELVLSRELGGAHVMKEAMTRLAESARRPSVNVQVIPAGEYHVGLQGAFDLAEVNGTVASLFIDDITDGRTTNDPATVADVTQRYRHLQSLALPVSQSLGIIDKAVERWA